jgi:hypothetical protein
LPHPQHSNPDRYARVVPDEESAPDIDELVAALRQRIEGRRREGVYPIGLEAQLERHFRQIVADLDRPQPDIPRVRDAVDRVTRLPAFSPERIVMTSRLPGGQSVHALAGKAVSRQTIGVLQQMQQFAAAVQDALLALFHAAEVEAGDRQRLLEDTVAGVLDRLAVLDELVTVVRDIDTRLHRLEETTNRS